jgi:hypothetical protein
VDERGQLFFLAKWTREGCVSNSIHRNSRWYRTITKSPRPSYNPQTCLQPSEHHARKICHPLGAGHALCTAAPGHTGLC